MSEALLAEYIRDGIVESKHFGHLVALDKDGNVKYFKGDGNALIFPRSAVKSIQASAMVRVGLKLNPKQLALVCASHSGSDEHQKTALEILATVGLDESSLQCVMDKPLGDAERRAWGDKPATRLAMNCSGKHSGMVATTALNNWPIESYLDRNHPLQLAIKAEFELLSGEQMAATSIDGCGAPLFLFSLRGLATAIHRLMISTDPVHREVVNACLVNPKMIAGVGRLDTELMSQYPGLFLKGGAEGVQVAAYESGISVAFKVSDGSFRAHEVILANALAQLGVDIEVHKPEVMGGGNKIGEIRATK